MTTVPALAAGVAGQSLVTGSRLTSGNPTPRINRVVLGYLRDISGISQGYDHVLEIMYWIY
jgi:hypothetical protein